MMMKMNRISRTSIALFFLLLLFALLAIAQARVRWPEVVGLAPDLAQKRIMEDMPAAQFQVLNVGSSVTMEFIPWRVRLFVDSAGIVARIPVVG